MRVDDGAKRIGELGAAIATRAPIGHNDGAMFKVVHVVAAINRRHKLPKRGPNRVVLSA